MKTLKELTPLGRATVVVNLFIQSGLSYDEMLEVVELIKYRMGDNPPKPYTGYIEKLRETADKYPYTEGAADEQADWTPPKPE